MPAKDFYHDAVRNALVKDGWIITHDPYTLSFGRTNVYIDIGAEYPIAAEKNGRKIAVEVKSFSGASEVSELERAIGQYILYRTLLARIDDARCLYLAVPEPVANGILSELDAALVIEAAQLRFVVFLPDQEVIVRWIPQPPQAIEKSSAS